MNNILVCTAMLLVGILASCASKDEGKAPTPTGSISGICAPAEAISLVTATNPAGSPAKAQPSVNRGFFSLVNMAPGIYQLDFTNGFSYGPAPSRLVKVIAGQNVAIDTVRTIFRGGPLDPITGQFAVTGYVYGGGPYIAHGDFAFASMVDNELLITIYAPGTPATSVSIYLGNVTGPGTYSLIASPNTATYKDIFNTSYYKASTGNVIITSLNSTTRQIRGTFGFVGAYLSNPSATVNINSGEFNLKY